jgi:hypothetical protein
MTIAPQYDTVSFQDGDGNLATAKVVVVVNKDGSPLSGSNAAPTVQRDALLSASDLSPAVVSINTVATTPIVTAAAAQTTRVHRVRLNVAGAQQITVQSGGATLEVLNFTGSGFMVYDFSSRPWYVTAVNTALNFVTSTTAQVNGVVEYVRSA